MLIAETKENVMSAITFESAILPHLSDGDDARFWLIILDDLTQEFSSLGLDECASHKIFLQIGACSHWLRPHQTRLTAAGGFALPAGYLGSGSSRDGLPEFDWFVLLHRNQIEGSWEQSDKFFGKRQLVCRVALPTRTLQHNQAVISVLWSPGTPVQPKQKTKSFYAYRKNADGWKQTATGAS